MSFRIRVLGFEEGGAIPARYSREGENLAPALEWSDIPSGTRSLALVLEDPDAPSGVFTHWLLFDIPPACTGLAEGFQPGQFGTSGWNDFEAQSYDGPQPPVGHGPHRYFFRLFALDTPRLLVHGEVHRWEFDKALRGHVIDECSTMGRFERRSRGAAV